jgi:hypothetical protein
VLRVQEFQRGAGHSQRLMDAVAGKGIISAHAESPPPRNSADCQS